MPTPIARVCLIAPEFIGPFPNGGVGTACYWEAATLSAAGFEVTVLYTGPTESRSPDHWERTYRAGPFHYVDLWRWAGESASAAGAAHHPCAEAWTAELVLRFLREHRFDLLLFQEFLGHGLRALQARRSGDALAETPAAVTLHSCRQWIYQGMQRMPSAPQDLYVDFLERESARLADHVAAPSRHMAEWAAAHWRLDGSSIVPYCYDATIERPAALVEHRGPFKQLVFFGRLETRKGLHLFCRALAQHDTARGPITHVTFLGKNSRVEGRPSDQFIRQTLGRIPGLTVRVISDLGSLEALAWLERQKNTIVVAPSLVDNLPYAVIELFARRLPIVTTRVGGIPEIIGRANDQALAEPTTEGVAHALSEVHRRGSLAIDYRAGYSIDESNARHVAWVRSLLDRTRPATVRSSLTLDLVIVDATREQLPAIRGRFVAEDASAGGSRFLTMEDWRAATGNRSALFVSADVTPRAGMTDRLAVALRQRRVDAATSYYETHAPGGSHGIAPLGCSLEAGWTKNVFGGPCIAVQGRALNLLRSAARDGAFQFWPAYAALACADLEVAMVTECLYAVSRADAAVEGFERVAAIYRQHVPSRFDLGWVLQYASVAVHGGLASGLSAGRAFYERLTNTPDAQVDALAGLTWSAEEDSYAADVRQLRVRLAAVAAECEATHPRVYVYGAGEHAKVMLTLEPAIGRFVAGFIDRRPIASYLGKPCIRPEEFSPAIADAVIYSSREYEQEMRARLANVDVRHLLLYAEPEVVRADSAVRSQTSSRVRRRLGASDARVAELRAMYRPPAWVRGGCSGGDVEFLLECVAAIEPRLVLELGVASGTSSAALLFALDQLPCSSERLLYSGDVSHTCYFDSARPTGAAVQELYPRPRTRWLLDTNTDARRVRQSLPGGRADFCFIDANHYHPWPLLDLLHIATLARPEAWIALHDIELPRLHPQFQVHGAQWLFEAWPFNKIHGVDGSVNIGAVQLPADLERIVPVALELLQRPWEHSPTSWDVDLPEVFSDVTAFVEPLLSKPALAG